jgi:hypothetical protein
MSATLQAFTDPLKIAKSQRGSSLFSVGESAGLKSISAYLIWLGKGFRRTKKGYLNLELRCNKSATGEHIAVGTAWVDPA